MVDRHIESLLQGGTVVTASGRLARTLRDEYAVRQLSLGATAWRSPDIVAWSDWLAQLCDSARGQDQLPARINAHQSQWLWEKCWRQEVGDSVAGIANLVQLSRDAWQRLADWEVSIGDVAAAAQGNDQRTFAIVAGRYLHRLQRDGMVDDAGLGKLALKLLENDQIEIKASVSFAGFDRQKPIVESLQRAIRSLGGKTTLDNKPQRDPCCTLQVFENSTSEYRAAGAWARDQIERNPNSRIGIIASGLDSEGDSITRYVREGTVPGWQYGQPSLRQLVNTSFGRRLVDYPAVSIALTLLHWLVRDIGSTDVSLLLRSGVLGQHDLAGRSRLELRLRQLPDRLWSPSMITAELRGNDDSPCVSDWLNRLAAFSKRRRELPKSASPTQWAILMDETLAAFGWPGDVALDSADFQLVNRWRELLNDFARLALVSPAMTARVAIPRLESLAADTIYQAESTGALVQLLGPLEASGSEFDAVWITGLTSGNWPPASSASVLVSRRLQERLGMPDCNPQETLQHAQRVLAGLLQSSAAVVCSYAMTHEDTEQTVSELLDSLVTVSSAESADPGWHASTLRTNGQLSSVVDRVPKVVAGERIVGGAAAIQRQLSDPVSAFIQCRMATRVIYPQAIGIPAILRGNLVHDALFHVYGDLPSSESVANWGEDECVRRIDAAIDYAFGRHERNIDKVQRQLLQLERTRVAALVRQFIALDCSRDSFRVASVEGELEFISDNIRLPLRFDRLDSYDDGSIAILDYKTGSPKRLLNRNGEAQQIQLFVYACATDAVVSAVALVNVDSREIYFDGAGAGFSNADDWPQLFQDARNQVASACEELGAGDVRINLEQGIQAARPLNLLTRFTELRRDQR